MRSIHEPLGSHKPRRSGDACPEAGRPRAARPAAAQSEADTVGSLAELLTRASWRLRKNERGELQPFGLTFAQARALRVLVETGPMRIGELADRLEIVPRSATTRVDDLEKAGFALRRPHPEDRRSIMVEATDRGRELVSRLAAQRRAGAEALFAPLSPEDRERLVELLGSLTEEV